MRVAVQHPHASTAVVLGAFRARGSMDLEFLPIKRRNDVCQGGGGEETGAAAERSDAADVDDDTVVDAEIVDQGDG